MSDLVETLEDCGVIVDVFIPRNKSGNLRFAFVTFTTKNAAEKAVRSETDYRVKMADATEPESPSGTETKILHIKGISHDADQDMLKATCEMFGKVVEFTVKQVPNSPVHYGFVEYERLNAAKELYKAGILGLIKSFKIHYNDPGAKKRQREE